MCLNDQRTRNAGIKSKGFELVRPVDLSGRIAEVNALEISYDAPLDGKPRFAGVVFVELVRLRKTQEVCTLSVVHVIKVALTCSAAAADRCCQGKHPPRRSVRREGWVSLWERERPAREAMPDLREERGLVTVLPV